MQNFEIFAGDTKKLNVTVTENGTAVNLTGATIDWVLKRSVTSATNDVSKSTSGGIAITDPTNGVFQITLIPSDTINLKGYYYHEAEVTDASGNVSTVFTGNVTIMASGV